MSRLGTDIWRAMTDLFRQRRGSRPYDLWLKGVVPVSLHKGLLTVEVDDENVKQVLDQRYAADLESIGREVTGSAIRVQTRLTDGGTDGGAPVQAAPPDRSSREVSRKERASRDVSEHTEHGCFIPTQASQLVHSAMSRLVVGPVTGYTPLYVYGPRGVGKTALAAEFLRRLAAHDSVVDPLVLSAESLVRDVQRSTREGTFGQLQRTWSGHDALVIDEFHRLAGKTTTQEVVVSLMAPLVERGGRVLLLSRHGPDAIFRLGERLRSHLHSAFAMALAAPDSAGRQQVLAGVLEHLQVGAVEGVLDELALRGPANLGDAVAVLTECAREAGARGRVLGLEDLAGRLAPRTRADGLFEQVLEVVSEACGVPADQIRSASKRREVAAARHLCVYLAAGSMQLSTRRISRLLRQSSPGIVKYSREKVDSRRSRDVDFDGLVRRLVDRLDGAQRELPWPG